MYLKSDILFYIFHVLCGLHYDTVYHPETNGQSEGTNQPVEQYPHCFVNYQQDDWVDLLHLA